MKRILRRREHEKTGSVHKVRCFKHRRSRSLHTMTTDHHGKHWRRHEAWKREKRRHRGNSKIHKHQRIDAANVWQQCDNSNLALLVDYGVIERKVVAAHPAGMPYGFQQLRKADTDHLVTPEPYKHFYDDHSPFKFRENE